MTCTDHARRQWNCSPDRSRFRKLHRKLETLVEYLTRANRVPPGTVLLTGTGIIVTRKSALAPGDVGDDLSARDRRTE